MERGGEEAAGESKVGGTKRIDDEGEMQRAKGSSRDNMILRRWRTCRSRKKDQTEQKVRGRVQERE